MVEGPLLHRLAFAHRKRLFGHKFTATSPSGRFANGAAAIDGHFLSHIEVHGKNIFYFFTRERVGEVGVLEKVGHGAYSGPLEKAVVVHIHLGMSGSFRQYKFPGPVPREATRLRLVNDELGIEEHLSAQVCDHGTIELYRKKILELGPDPLREDADKERLWASMQKTKRSIGAVLMDQSLVAGIGNIYRAEILFVVGLHPDQPANIVSRDKFEFLWEQSVRQMEIGVEVGNIITVLPEDAGKPRALGVLRSSVPSKLRYVYNQKACGKCGGVIKVWTIAQRSAYACEACQPPPLDSPIATKRVLRKTTADEADSISEDNGDDLHDDGVTLEKIPTRKRVAEGGKVVVHQAYKNEDPRGLPESFVLPTDEVKFHERPGSDIVGVAQTTPLQTDADNKAGIKYSSKSRRGRQGAGNTKIEMLESPEKDMVNGSASSGKRRSARTRNQAVTEAEQCLPKVGFRGQLEFPSPRVTRFSVQNFPPTFVKYGRESIALFRPLNASSSLKFSCATSSVRHFIRPLRCAQPVVAAMGSALVAGAVFQLRGKTAGAMQL